MTGSTESPASRAIPDATVSSGVERASAAPPLRVATVDTRRQRAQFIGFPYELYRHDPAWVPPLLAEQRHQFSPKSPFHQHAAVQMWLAYRGDRPVGRISAQVDRLRLERYADATGHFGVLEAVDDPAVFAALLGAAEDWLRAQGMRHVVGPFNLSINGDIGIVLDGFDLPPVFLSGHGRPYYDPRVREQGYRKTKDVVFYRLDPAVPPPRAMVESARRARESARITIRPIDKSRLAEEAAAISSIFNDAWADHWGFVPFTEAEFAELASMLKYLVPREFVQFGYVDGELAAMLVIVPNLNELISDLRGRLLPFGWLRLVTRLLRRSPRSARVALMGVRQKFQHSLLTMALAFGLIEAVREPVLQRHMRYLEMGWTLEDNFPMLRIKQLLGGHLCKTNRVYEKAL
ncbi:MAG: N-acetyltransferase [Candidatus Binatia bacterium]